MLAIEMVIEMVVPNTEYKLLLWEQMRSSFPSFFFLSMVVFCIFLIGCVIKILKAYKVNYQYIFELDP